MKNDEDIMTIIQGLENKIKAGDFEKIKEELIVEVNWAQFGGFMHKMNGELEDALACKTIEKTYNLSKREYAIVGKSDKEILDARLESY